MCVPPLLFIFFFFNDTATTEIYTLSLHDALPISAGKSNPMSHPGLSGNHRGRRQIRLQPGSGRACAPALARRRSEEHTSELQSLAYLVCRLLLEKKKIKAHNIQHSIDQLKRSC